MGQLISARANVAGELCADQVAPPSLLARIVPAAPTAKQALVVGQLTPFRSRVVPDGSGDQLSPPSSVLRIVPAAPTAMHMELSAGQLTPLSSVAVPERCATQLVPVVVEITLPEAPTATHWVADEQLTLLRSSPCGAGLSHCVEPSAGLGPAPTPAPEPPLGAGTAPAVGGQITVKMSSQPNGRKPTLSLGAPSPAA